jgi:cell fate regulator YaaT (PSP1 superfamily)
MKLATLSSGCSNCGIGNGHPKGCRNNGTCSTGGCNKLNSYNWLSDVVLPVDGPYDVAEVSFNQGTRKDFFRNSHKVVFATGDMVAVEAQYGFDIGQVSLSGELVRIQMRKKKVADDDRLKNVLRRAHERDLEKYEKLRKDEDEFLFRARVIARGMNLPMKVSQVECQKDGKRATFYYTAEGRVDFRELVRKLAQEFHIRVDMRQIGARQEAGKVGGIGSCGRELCCSSWLTQFKNVGTSAARYQQLAINQAKLTGLCGRLKCCLNYELDTYLDALKGFPLDNVRLKTKLGNAHQVKVDIFKNTLYYAYPRNPKVYKLTLADAQGVIEANGRGELPDDLPVLEVEAVETYDTYAANTEQVSLETLEKTARNRSRKHKRRRGRKR